MYKTCALTSETLSEFSNLLRRKSSVPIQLNSWCDSCLTVWFCLWTLSFAYCNLQCHFLFLILISSYWNMQSLVKLSMFILSPGNYVNFHDSNIMNMAACHKKTVITENCNCITKETQMYLFSHEAFWNLAPSLLLGQMEQWFPNLFNFRCFLSDRFCHHVAWGRKYGEN